MYVTLRAVSYEMACYNLQCRNKSDHALHELVLDVLRNINACNSYNRNNNNNNSNNNRNNEFVNAMSCKTIKSSL